MKDMRIEELLRSHREHRGDRGHRGQDGKAVMKSEE